MNAICTNPSGGRPSTATKTKSVQLERGKPAVGLGLANPHPRLSPCHNTHNDNAHEPWVTSGSFTRSMDSRGSPLRRSTHPSPYASATAHEASPEDRDVCRPRAGRRSRPGQGLGCRPGPTHKFEMRPAARGHARSLQCSRPFQAAAYPVQMRRQRK